MLGSFLLVFIVIYILLASGLPPAAHAGPSGLKRHSRGEEAFKEENFLKIFSNLSKFENLILYVHPWAIGSP